MAHCIQHEIDHLNGILFIDHLSRLKQERLRKKMEKLNRAELLETNFENYFRRHASFCSCCFTSIT